MADSFHRTRSSPDGKPIIGCIANAIKDAGLAPDDIDYVNAHGTGTPENDKMEYLGVSTVFGERMKSVPISSNKSMIGHTLSAAGAVEAVFSLLTLQHQRIPPTINYNMPDPAIPLDVVPNKARDARVTHAISNSFGFGGQNVSLVMGLRAGRNGRRLPPAMRVLTTHRRSQARTCRGAGAAAAWRRRGADPHQGGRAQSSRPLGLPRHGLRQAQAAAGGRRGGLRRDRRGRRRRHQFQARRQGRDVRRHDLRALRRLPRGPRQSVRERRRHHGLSHRRLRPRIDQSAGAIGDPGAGRRVAARCGLRADRLRHRRAHAVRQRQAQARRNHSGACRRLRHRLGRHQDGQSDRLHRHHHGRRRRQGGKSQSARRRSRHQLQDRTLRGRHPQAHRQERRRRRVRARRRRRLQRFAVLPQARRSAGHLRLDRGSDRHHQSDAAVPAAVQDFRLVRRLDAQYPRQPVEDRRRHGADHRQRGSARRFRARDWRASKAGRCSAKSSCLFSSCAADCARRRMPAAAPRRQTRRQRGCRQHRGRPAQADAARRSRSGWRIWPAG